MSVSLKWCKFEHTELSIHFESFNGECTCAIVKETQDSNLLSQESKLVMGVNLQLNWCPLKLTIPVLKRILFQDLKVNFQP